MCTIKIYTEGGRDTLFTLSSALRTILPLFTPYFKMFLERLFDDLPTLKYGRRRVDMIIVYKILNDVIENFFRMSHSYVRRHCKKLYKPFFKLTLFRPGGSLGTPKVFVHNSNSFLANSLKFGDFS